MHHLIVTYIHDLEPVCPERPIPHVFVPLYTATMTDSDSRSAGGSGELTDLINRGVESLALLLELVTVLKSKGILTEAEIDEMGQRADRLRTEILKGQIPS
jgi:hypothetical protein